MWGSIGEDALSGLVSGGIGSLLAGNNPAPSATVLPNQGQAAGQALGDINSLNNPYPQLQPMEMQQLLAMMNNPNIKGYLASAGQAGKASTAAGGTLANEANQLYQQAYDPQNALKAQLQGQVQDQANVQNSMYGLQSSPYGAGVANQALGNFDINWQNQQLGREAQANPLIGQDLAGSISAYQQGGAIPYGAYGQVNSDLNNAINQYVTQAGAGNSLTQNQIGDLLQYLGTGQSGVGLNQNAYGMNQNTAANYGAALYPAVSSGFGSLFSGSGNQAPQASFGGTLAQPVQPVDTGLTSQQLSPVD